MRQIERLARLEGERGNRSIAYGMENKRRARMEEESSYHAGKERNEKEYPGDLWMP